MANVTKHCLKVQIQFQKTSLAKKLARIKELLAGADRCQVKKLLACVCLRHYLKQDSFL